LSDIALSRPERKVTPLHFHSWIRYSFCAYISILLYILLYITIYFLDSLLVVFSLVVLSFDLSLVARAVDLRDVGSKHRHNYVMMNTSKTFITTELLSKNDIFVMEEIRFMRLLFMFSCDELFLIFVTKHCKFSSVYEHCAIAHESKECILRNEDLICNNCKQCLPQESHSHSALDNKNCPILRKRISDRIKNINYG